MITLGFMGLGVGISLVKDLKKKWKKYKQQQREQAQAARVIEHLAVHPIEEQVHELFGDDERAKLEDIEKLYTCPLTLKMFNEPCILRCCLTRVEKYQITRRIQDGSGSIMCPFCKLHITMDDVKDDHAFNEIYKHHKKQIQEDRQNLKKLEEYMIIDQ